MNEVTEAMIEAGMLQLSNPTEEREWVRAIYLAMQAASPRPTGDVVEAIGDLIASRVQPWAKQLALATEEHSPELDTRKLAIEILATMQPADPVEPKVSSDVVAWECFSDVGYYDMWCVREVGEKRWGHGFHVPSKLEAEGLTALLNELTALRASEPRHDALVERIATACEDRVREWLNTGVSSTRGPLNFRPVIEATLRASEPRHDVLVEAAEGAIVALDESANIFTGRDFKGMAGIIRAAADKLRAALNPTDEVRK